MWLVVVAHGLGDATPVRDRRRPGNSGKSEEGDWVGRYFRCAIRAFTWDELVRNGRKFAQIECN